MLNSFFFFAGFNFSNALRA
jgi:hypothetical protein